MSDGLPAGWWSAGGVVTPSGLVAAYAARAQPVRGVCRAKGCNRRVVIDPKELCGQGLGRLNMAKVQRLYECGRLNGCGVQWHREPAGNPLRLEAFAGRPNVRVRVKCRGDKCNFFRLWRVEEVVAGLIKRKQGDGRTEIDRLAGMMSSPCPLCKRRSWDVHVLWWRTDTSGWKALGEKNFERMEAV